VIPLEPDGHITLQLHPFEIGERYNNFRCAKVVRWQPPLDEYSRNERADITPCTDKRLIYAYFKRKLPESTQQEGYCDAPTSRLSFTVQRRAKDVSIRNL